MAPASTEQKRVLVIDDDSDCADTIAMVLRRFGAQVTVAYSGESGVKEFSVSSHNLVFLDIGMPKMDGYATARALRACQGDRHVRIIALTGWGRCEDRERTIQGGFDLHLVKPVDAHQLKDILES
ncbi:response regulator [Methylocystis sp. IM3]|jgi:CheY-like chemotaxis protein|uniref:response regulator n=1 Tax=unclassified Methylocystis TaxID=2625913 RepID=UPI000FC27F69|nr:MAG: response regulator [Hyphomicrobiales bacterium]